MTVEETAPVQSDQTEDEPHKVDLPDDDNDLPGTLQTMELTVPIVRDDEPSCYLKDVAFIAFIITWGTVYVLFAVTSYYNMSGDAVDYIVTTVFWFSLAMIALSIICMKFMEFGDPNARYATIVIMVGVFAVMICIGYKIIAPIVKNHH